MLELWGMQNTTSLPSLPDPLWPGVIAPDRFLSIVQIEINSRLILNWIVWNRNVNMFFKMVLALRNLLWLICRKPNQTKPNNVRKHNYKKMCTDAHTHTHTHTPHTPTHPHTHKQWRLIFFIMEFQTENIGNNI